MKKDVADGGLNMCPNHYTLWKYRGSSAGAAASCYATCIILWMVACQRILKSSHLFNPEFNRTFVAIMRAFVASRRLVTPIKSTKLQSGVRWLSTQSPTTSGPKPLSPHVPMPEIELASITNRPRLVSIRHSPAPSQKFCWWQPSHTNWHIGVGYT